MDETILTWNVENMITIWLMAFLGCMILMFIAQLWNNSAMAQGNGSGQ